MNVEQAEAVRAKVCGEKIAYGATTARKIARTMEATDRGYVRMAGYRCPFCGSWHVGHALSISGMRLVAVAVRVLSGNAPGEPTGWVPRRDRRRRRPERLREPESEPDELPARSPQGTATTALRSSERPTWRRKDRRRRR